MLLTQSDTLVESRVHLNALQIATELLDTFRGLLIFDEELSYMPTINVYIVSFVRHIHIY